MSNPEVMDDEQAALARLLNPASSPITTPEMLIKFGVWMMAKVRQEIADNPAPVGQVWATPGQIAKIYGVERQQANRWLRRLRELGKVKPQCPISGKHDKGDMKYNLREIAAAFAENAERVERGKS